MKLSLLLFSSLCLAAPPIELRQTTPQPTIPPTTSGKFLIPNFAFDSGATLPTLELHYKTLGTLRVHKDGSTNAVLIIHGTAIGDSSQFLNTGFGGTLFNPGQTLDAKKYFIILPDSIGHGNSSSPRNTGLRAKFPSYQYSDMIRATYQLITEHLGVKHLRLVMGPSMGGMHTWMMGEKYPDFMDALMPIASLPVQIGGHNRLFRKMFMNIVLRDPEWNNGEFEIDNQPLNAFRGAMGVLQLMNEGIANLNTRYPSRDGIDAYYATTVDGAMAELNKWDLLDGVFAWNASHTYDPEAELKLIKAPLTAVNTADDLMNPLELRILERAVREQMVKGVGRAVVIPTSSETFGHGSYQKAALLKKELQLLLHRTEKRH